MRATEKLKKACFRIATIGALGEWWLGGAIASVLSIPLLFLLQSLYWLSQPIFYWTLLLGAILFLAVIQAALLFNYERAARAIVCDKIIGAMIALAGVPLRWRVVIFGFILFHVLNTIKPFAFYRKVLDQIERLPGAFGVLLPEIISGAIVNVFLNLIAWVMG